MNGDYAITPARGFSLNERVATRIVEITDAADLGPLDGGTVLIDDCDDTRHQAIAGIEYEGGFGIVLNRDHGGSITDLANSRKPAANVTPSTLIAREHGFPYRVQQEGHNRRNQEEHAQASWIAARHCQHDRRHHADGDCGDQRARVVAWPIQLYSDAQQADSYEQSDTHDVQAVDVRFCDSRGVEPSKDDQREQLTHEQDPEAQGGENCQVKPGNYESYRRVPILADLSPRYETLYPHTHVVLGCRNWQDVFFVSFLERYLQSPHGFLESLEALVIYLTIKFIDECLLF